MELAADPDDDPLVVDDPDALDVVGHGTACAGIIHAIAPGADLVSVRVLGPDNRGKGIVFAAGLDWAIEHGAAVVNLSLSSKSEALFGLFHDLADRAYFANVLLVCAANNVPGNSYPSLFASVVSVAAHDLADAAAWFYNPDPPVEFGAHGVDVDVAWRDGGRDDRDRQLVRRAPPGRVRGAHPGEAPVGVAVRGQGDPGRDRLGAARSVASAGGPPSQVEQARADERAGVHELEEVGAVERQQGAVGDRRHGRRARNPAQESDLAEHLARAHRPEVLRVGHPIRRRALRARAPRHVERARPR